MLDWSPIFPLLDLVFTQWNSGSAFHAPALHPSQAFTLISPSARTKPGINGQFIYIRWFAANFSASLEMTFQPNCGGGTEVEEGKTEGYLELPGWLSGKESARQCRRRELDPWVRKIFWRRKWQPIPVFLPGESLGQRSRWATVHGVTKELDTT